MRNRHLDRAMGFDLATVAAIRTQIDRINGSAALAPLREVDPEIYGHQTDIFEQIAGEGAA